jgi:hypothetical protein
MRYGFNQLSDDEFIALCKAYNKSKGLYIVGKIREIPPMLVAFDRWRKGLTYVAAMA